MELELKNVGIIKSAHLEFIQGLNLIVGSSSSGKSTLLRAIRCMMDNSFSDSNISYGQKKLAIRMKYNDHSATYIRDLDNQSRKSAYQVDGKVYTKVGRSSLEDLSNIFKLAPVEIDGEKINFNFSAQFSGPFLLLGSPSLLYSILTYRSSFDITKINDLYYTDVKKIKQDINVLMKTKESLDKEKENKEKQLSKLESFPTVFLRVQKLKQQYESLQRQKDIYTSYRSTINQKESIINRLNRIEKILSLFDGYDSRLKVYSSLYSYNLIRGNHIDTSCRISEVSKVLLRIADLLPDYEYTRLLSSYITLKSKYDNNHSLLSSIEIQNPDVILSLVNYIKSKELIVKEKDTLQETQKQLNGVLSSIKEVDVCPLCGQQLCNC